MNSIRISRRSWIAVLALLCTTAAAAEKADPKTPIANNSDAAAPSKPRNDTPSLKSNLPPAAGEKPSLAPAAKTPPASGKPGAQDRQSPAATADAKASEGKAAGIPIVAPKTRKLIRVFQLNNPAASMVAQVLNVVLVGDGRGADSPRITADGRRNSTIASGKVKVEELRDGIFVFRDGAREADSPGITADVNGNSIVAYGTVQELDEIKDIIKLLDAPQLGPGDLGPLLATHDIVSGGKVAAKPAPGKSAAAPTTRKQLAVYRLKYAAAWHAISVLQGVFGSVNSLRLDANVVNNSIIAFGEVKTIREIVALLQVLDIPRTTVDVQRKSGSSQPSATQLKIFRLMNSDAFATAAMLQELFSSGRGDTSVKISTDPRTNSIIARGPAETLREIEALVLRLDASQPARAGAARDGTRGSASPSAAQLPGDPVTLDRLATDRLQQYHDLERQASGMAAAIRKLPKGARRGPIRQPVAPFARDRRGSLRSPAGASARQARAAPPASGPHRREHRDSPADQGCDRRAPRQGPP